ncbi:hypothetical protein TL16_g05474 [Triparma laevis f. inornata]|uniref:PX domain-containing protein n=1 Tax=Triparma laevis f. inornata TaxID=1714386 RepID=A0A9W7E717_9STRA|nr:hypothetical protein TL16_g05474 [Triparma laevis f. inornata]
MELGSSASLPPPQPSSIASVDPSPSVYSSGSTGSNPKKSKAFRPSKFIRKYSVTVTSSPGETTVVSTLYRFGDFRDLHAVLSPDLPKAKISTEFFPRTYRKSQFGIKLSQEQLNKRLTLINQWIERVVENSTKLGPASQSALTLFLAPPQGEEHEMAKIIQKRQRQKMEMRRYVAAGKIQSVLRMKKAGRIMERKRVDFKATLIQKCVRRKGGEKLLVVKKRDYAAAVKIQAIVRKIRDTERFFKLAKKMRLEGKFDNNYEDLGRHSESGYMRKLSSTQIPQKVVYTGSMKVDGVLLFLRVLTEQIQQGHVGTKAKPESSKKKSNLGHVISHTLDVHASSVIDDTTYNCKISDFEVQVVLGMMSSVDSCVQENKVIMLLRSLELVDKMVPVKSSKKIKKKKGEKEQEMIKVLQIKNEKHTNEVSYDLLLQGVRCVEKKKGIDSINIDASKPRRLSLIVNGKADNEIELCDEVTALRVKNTLERFRRDSQERLLEKGKRETLEREDSDKKVKGGKEKEGGRYTSLMQGQPTMSNMASNVTSRSSKQFNSNTSSSRFSDDTTIDNATVISDVTMDTLEEQHRIQIQKSRIGEINKKGLKKGKKGGKKEGEMDFGVGVFESLMKDGGGRGRINS